MKKKFLIISILSTIFGFSVAQNESAVGDENYYLTNAPEFSVVRNWQNTYTFSVHGNYIVKDNFGMTCATTGSQPFLSALITDAIPNLNINDMRFVNNYAFICGDLEEIVSQNVVVRGFLGFFDLNEFYVNNTLNIKLHIYDDIKVFTKLVAYIDNGAYKVVSIGAYREYGSGAYFYPSCLVEDNVMATPPPSPQIIRFEYFQFNPPKEYITDLVLTNEYVVLVGKRHAYYQGAPYTCLCVRLADRHNVVNGSIVNTRYYYDAGEEEPNEQIKATLLSNNSFAMVYTHRKNVAGNILFSTRVRVIEIPSMTMLESQEFPTYDKDEPLDLAYDSVNDILTLLHPMPFNYHNSYSYSYYVQLDLNPSISPYMAPVLTPPQGLYTSIDMFNNVYYVSTGQNHWYYQHTTAPQPNVNQCPKLNKIDIQRIDKIPTATNYNYNLVNTTVHTDVRLVHVNLTKIELDCDDE